MPTLLPSFLLKCTFLISRLLLFAECILKARKGNLKGKWEVVVVVAEAVVVDPFQLLIKASKRELCSYIHATTDEKGLQNTVPFLQLENWASFLP